MSGEGLTRRGFLRRAAGYTAGATGLGFLLPRGALGQAGRPTASERVTVGCIGVGWQGEGNMNSFLRNPLAQVVAVCDVDAGHLRKALDQVNRHYGNEDCAAYHDFRELLARDDIDALCLSLPDHWHAVAAIAACRAGKDMYAEKPLSHDLLEGRAICEAVAQHGRIWQTGSWQRSVREFRFAAELVRNGRIGRVHRVEVGLPSGHTDFAQTKGQDAIQAPPAELDWQMWVGPARWQPYRVSCVHKNWRWVQNTGGGQLMDWVGHHLDIAHWGLGFDETGPYEVEAKGEWLEDGVWDTATKYRVDCKYPKGIDIVIGGGYDDSPRGGTKWIGDEGWVWVNRNGFEAEPASLLNEHWGPNDIRLYRSDDHVGNFLECVKSRQPTVTPCEVAHRSATPGHLGMISMQVGRRIRWDAAKEEIIGDATATRLLGRAKREPWHL